MATPKQRAANAANARKSTGPRTEAGKHIARLNAYKHGLTGQLVLRTPHEHAAYEAYSAGMMSDLAPAGSLELSLANRIVADTWRLERAHILERGLYEIADADADAEAARTFDTGHPGRDELLSHASQFHIREKTFSSMSLYMARIQRGLLKDIDTLRKIQKSRREAELQAAKQAAAIKRQPAKVVDFPTASPEIGSVCSAPSANAAPLPETSPTPPAAPPAPPAATPENMVA